MSTDKLREARGLLAELSGRLEAYSEYERENWLAQALLNQSKRIEQFLKGPGA